MQAGRWTKIASTTVSHVPRAVALRRPHPPTHHTPMQRKHRFPHKIITRLHDGGSIAVDGNTQRTSLNASSE